MGISTYPRYGFRLAPLALKEILDVYAPKHLVKQENIKLFELDESSWKRFGSDNCLTLSEIIIKRCNAFFFLMPTEITEKIIPQFSHLENLQNIELESATFDCLENSFSNKKNVFSKLTVGKLLNYRCLGMRGLIDLLTSLETGKLDKVFHEQIKPTFRNYFNKKNKRSVSGKISKIISSEESYYDIFVKALHIVESNFERRTRKYPKWVGKMKMPLLPQEFNYFELELKIRTENALNKIGIWEEPQRLSNKTVKDLLTLKNFGVLSLLDLMKNLEPYVKQFHSDIINEEIRISQKPLVESISYQPSFTQNRRKINSVELKNEAANLLELEFVESIKSEDFRFGDFIRRIDKKAEDVSDLAKRIIIDENILTDETKTLLLLKELGEIVSTIQTMKLEDELESYLQPIIIERDRKIVAGRFGLNGKGLSTLQAIGDEFQVTRERIRQICKKWADGLQESNIFAPKIENTIQFIAENAPNSCDVMMEKLVLVGLTRKPFQLENIKEITNLFKIDCPFILKEVDGKMYILSDENEMTVNLIHKKARKAIEHWGASTIEEIAFQLDEEKQTVSNEFVEQVLTSKDDFCWLDKESGWFWLKSVPRNRLYNQMRKVLSVAEKIDISELRSGISRHHRTRSLSPPKRVLLEFCKQTNLGRIEDGLIIPDSDLNWEEELSETEQFLVLILKENSNVMRRVEFEKVCMELGMSNPAFQVYLSYSPVIVKFGIGVYGLRGINIPIGLIESITNTTSRRRGRVLKDFGWKNNNIWIAYQLSESAIKSGVIGVPSAVKDYIEGEFRLRTEENESVGRIVIKETSAWGFSPFFRRRGGEIGDYMLLLFDTKNMEITIHIGDKDLIEEFQEADS